LPDAKDASVSNVNYIGNTITGATRNGIVIQQDYEVILFDDCPLEEWKERKEADALLDPSPPSFFRLTAERKPYRYRHKRRTSFLISPSFPLSLHAEEAENEH
jgi:hypothetical protein